MVVLQVLPVHEVQVILATTVMVRFQLARIILIMERLSQFITVVINLRYVTHIYDSYYVITQRELKDNLIFKNLKRKNIISRK